MSNFDRVSAEITWQGQIFTAGVEHFRHADGQVVSREKVWHPGAVGILAVDSEVVWLTRQPREPADLSASLEIPAGKRDVEGEPTLRTAQRELAEEIGKQAQDWRELEVFFTSPGFSDERVWLYLARDLSDAPDAEPDPGEMIEIVPWPLDELDAALEECEDSKSLIALYWLVAQLERGTLPEA
ncbi:MAG: 8-oxo-dGDP phosphatase [Solirubrobacteraceae bacterium]|jgi:ADP-ribose pyrophosphatase|nr:8-oxo-dGDP phosphatase [Solirubrobacteraceae bacterium]